MDSGVGSTTVTEAASSRARADAQPRRLIWRFPRSETDVPLTWEGDGEKLIGRDAGCAVCLPGNDVSRRHAALRKLDASGAITIADLGSRNGVRVDGRLVSTARLETGNVVRIGGWIGVVATAAGDFKELAPGLLGGAVLQEAVAPLQRAAASDLPIVLQGETNTGKEVAAAALHRWSGRSGPFVAVNCAALPEALAEGELFGYRRGAFTGADRASPGLFRSAHGGTLLLDEVPDLPLPLQAKLLRVLEQREVLPLGETRPVPVDVRVVVAGQQSLMEAVRAGRFRADLLARLEGLTVQLPPLRQRREDVLPLFAHLLQKLGDGRVPAMDTDVAERLCVHDWPFNVRELVLLVRSLRTLHGDATTLQLDHLPARMREGGSPAPNPSAGAGGPPAAAPAAAAEPVDLPALIAALRTAGGNVARAATLLGISRQRAYRLMEGQIDLNAIRKGEDGAT
ncbi:MAG TPA: sigma 54-interacting transcriptional regulator [Polyangia bacterium]|nr:sigma 54-interacting transcriptional regulator [Polyangia bacterium]